MSETRQPYRFTPSRNWALHLGSLLALFVLAIAWFGPLLAPADPLQESYIAEVEDGYIRPPFPPGTENYLLGSDEFGRDVLSRLLWAVRPTMILVVVVAALRLSVGFIAGLLTGWSGGRFSRVLDTIISSSLAVPVLFIALCIIAAFASKWGVWAFIVGLSITGWAESARLVQEQTRAMKVQPFIEATRALGAGSGQVIVSHVIPHVLPMVLIQLAFEVSGTLLTTAALGFLGYFVNAVWIPIEDFTGLRASGAPELGQMLGVSSQNQPWTAMLAGTMVFIVILAFNLLGEGLRTALSPERRRKKARSAQVVDRAGSWLEERVYFAATEWRRTAATTGVFSLLLLVIIGGGWALFNAQNSARVLTKVLLPGGNLWSAELRDPQGTSWSTVSGPIQPGVRWVYASDQPFTGGPVIDSAGNLYLNGQGAKLYSLNPAGVLRWQADLPAEPVGWPALTPEGNVIVADINSNLTAFGPDGSLLWQYQSDPPDTGLSSPIVGPSGLIYYTLKNFVVAVSPEGKRVWQILIPTYSYSMPLPRLSPDGSLLFFENVMIDARTGETLVVQELELMNSFLVGADGKIYFRTSDKFFEWRTTDTGAVLVKQAQLEGRVLMTNYRFPFDAGVSPSRHPWLLYSSPYEYPRLVWTDQKGQSPQIIDFPYRPGKVIGMDADGVAYACGVMGFRQPAECRAVRLSSGMLLWKTSLESSELPVGGSLAEGTLYITVENKLIALGN